MKVCFSDAPDTPPWYIQAPIEGVLVYEHISTHVHHIPSSSLWTRKYCTLLYAQYQAKSALDGLYNSSSHAEGLEAAGFGGAVAVVPLEKCLKFPEALFHVLVMKLSFETSHPQHRGPHGPLRLVIENGKSTSPYLVCLRMQGAVCYGSTCMIHIIAVGTRDAVWRVR
ncbi:hypothetical protein IAQ61_002301, partial [Plenodomus lingam]